jgi:hypothetical protein
VKKVSLLILLVIVLSTALMAAVPTKMMRLTIINKSGYDVYMKLTGSAATEAFYYLTIPSGSRDDPTVKVFTIMSDAYSRETWQCNGVKSSGTLVADGNLRLTFLPCGQFICSFTRYHLELWGCEKEIPTVVGVTHRRAGEPTMEKVTYFKYLRYGRPVWTDADLYNGYWNFGCFTWYWRVRTYSAPLGCYFRYQY